MDQNLGSALLEFSMRTAMLGTSHVSSTISVSHNKQNFITFPHLLQQLTGLGFCPEVIGGER